jgi:hypothetical protein
MSFVKLKNNFVVGDFIPTNIKNQYGYDTPLGFFGIKYCYIDINNPEKLINIFPEKQQKDCTLSVMDINYNIPPHTDSGISAIINFYIKSDNCVTQFYKIKNQNYNSMQIQNQTDGIIFDTNDLEETVSFIAKDNEAYLLDVSQPHAVFSADERQMVQRKAITLQIIGVEFEEAKEMLMETGQL